MKMEQRLRAKFLFGVGSLEESHRFAEIISRNGNFRKMPKPKVFDNEPPYRYVNHNSDKFLLTEAILCHHYRSELKNNTALVVVSPSEEENRKVLENYQIKTEIILHDLENTFSGLDLMAEVDWARFLERGEAYVDRLETELAKDQEKYK
ncbi:MAG: hypothetical protein AABW90_00885 [Nanoarchaeota archaeon]